MRSFPGLPGKYQSTPPEEVSEGMSRLRTSLELRCRFLGIQVAGSCFSRPGSAPRKSSAAGFWVSRWSLECRCSRPMYLGWVCTQPLLERSFSQTKYKYGSAPNLCSRDVSRKQVQVSGPPLAPPFFAGSSFSWKRGIRTKYQVPVQGHAQNLRSLE